MINYSITMRSVNSNLLEINQAKSRINQAKREGKNHRPGRPQPCEDREVCQAHLQPPLILISLILNHAWTIDELGFRCITVYAIISIPYIPHADVYIAIYRAV